MIAVSLIDQFKDITGKISDKLIDGLKTVDPLITGVHFDYGHYTDIQERLIAKGKTNKSERYPMIWLIEDYRTRHLQEGLTGISDLKIMILHLSKNTVTREWREENVFKPILYPIYYEFLKQIKLNGNFLVYDETKIQHDEIKRPHWGDPKLYKNESYLFTDVLDGIEITNMQLKIFLETCPT